MKKVFMVLAAALIALPIFAQQKTPTPSAGSSRKGKGYVTGQGGNAREVTVTPTPAPADVTTINNSKSNNLRQRQLVTGKVISQSGTTFTVISNGKEVTFSAAKLTTPPKVGDIIDINYTQTPNGPLEATTVKSAGDATADRIFCGDHTDTPRCCRHGGGYWVDLGDGGGCNFYYYSYRVMQVNIKDKSFTAMAKGKLFTFSSAKLKDVPKVGETIDITYARTPGGPMEATAIVKSKSNITNN